MTGKRQVTPPQNLSCAPLLALPARFPHKVPPTLRSHPMPTLFRFLFILAVIAGIVYGSMVALVFLVEPREREITVRIPSERLNPPQP
jgi:hypothetical protein